MTPETRNCSSFDVDELFADVIVAVPWPDCGWKAIEVGAVGRLGGPRVGHRTRGRVGHDVHRERLGGGRVRAVVKAVTVTV